jgi:hypothetical protein
MVRAFNSRGFLVVAGVCGLLAACSSSSNSTTVPDSGGGGSSSNHSSSKSSSGKSSTGKSSSESSKKTESSSSSKKEKDSGIEDAPKAMTDSGTGKCDPDAGVAGLYDRLGGHDGIRKAVAAVVAQELMNADIKSYFFYQTTGAAPKDGHPSAAQIEECFTDFVGNTLGGKEKYPTTLKDGKYDGGAGNGWDGGTYTCRDLKLAHKDLQIDEGTFDVFVSIAGKELLALGVCPSDVAILGKALLSLESEIVTDNKKSDAAEPFPGKVDAALHIAPDAG